MELVGVGVKDIEMNDGDVLVKVWRGRDGLIEGVVEGESKNYFCTTDKHHAPLPSQIYSFSRKEGATVLIQADLKITEVVIRWFGSLYECREWKKCDC
jgi:hypothetical protein